MKTFQIYFYILLLLLGGIFCGCQENDRLITFRGISINDTGGQRGLCNPDRGFRLEVAVDAEKDHDCPTRDLETMIDRYLPDSVSLVQSYLYLTYTIGQPLTPKHFDTMQRYFDELQLQGKKAILRFAYERSCEGERHVGPTLQQALDHLDQLKPFLAKNKDLILVVQAGIIGAWGEWHSSAQGLENSPECMRSILMKLLEVVPADKQIQVRVPEYKNLLKDEPHLYNRLSFHDDFIVIRPDKWDGDMHEGTPYFNQMVKESPYLIVDGELPWGFWSVGADPSRPAVGWLIDGIPTARRLFLQHYTSLSLVHNYKEVDANRKLKGDLLPPYSMIHWKKTMLNEDTLRKYHMPISDLYFTDNEGNKVERNVFDYIRDHLGYRIELQQLRLPLTWRRDQEVPLELTLKNRGFATVFGNHSVSFVLIDKKGQIAAFPTDANPTDWQPSLPDDTTHTVLIHSVKTKIKLSEKDSKGSYKLGLWIPDNSERLMYNARYAIRCANGNTTWYVSPDHRYGINILGTVDIR